jgi:hypothetical protein
MATRPTGQFFDLIPADAGPLVLGIDQGHAGGVLLGDQARQHDPRRVTST